MCKFKGSVEDGRTRKWGKFVRKRICEDFGQGNRPEMHLKLLGKKGKTRTTRRAFTA